MNTTPRLTTIELYEEQFNFSIAHFTIFSPTSRERLHGHNYRAKAFITAEVSELGLSFDYAIYKQKLIALTQQLNTYLLLPGESPVLKIEDQGENYGVYFHEDKMQFLKKDVIVMPLRNITLEELSRWFLEKILEDQTNLKACRVHAITVKVSNGHGRDGSASWGE